jgi:hypothetical protein
MSCRKKGVQMKIVFLLTMLMMGCTKYDQSDQKLKPIKIVRHMSEYQRRVICPQAFARKDSFIVEDREERERKQINDALMYLCHMEGVFEK